jgi:hypothetical protein
MTVRSRTPMEVMMLVKIIGGGATDELMVPPIDIANGKTLGRPALNPTTKSLPSTHCGSCRRIPHAAPPTAVSDHRRQSVGCVFRRGYRSRAGQRQRLGTLRYCCEREYRRGCDAEAANHAASRTGVVHR